MKNLIVILAGPVISYFWCSFLIWNMNPGDWSSKERLAFLFFSFAFSSVGFGWKQAID